MKFKRFHFVKERSDRREVWSVESEHVGNHLAKFMKPGHRFSIEMMLPAGDNGELDDEVGFIVLFQDSIKEVPQQPINGVIHALADGTEILTDAQGRQWIRQGEVGTIIATGHEGS